jgi:hypothetical protein
MNDRIVLLVVRYGHDLPLTLIAFGTGRLSDVSDPGPGIHSIHVLDTQSYIICLVDVHVLYQFDVSDDCSRDVLRRHAR